MKKGHLSIFLLTIFFIFLIVLFLIFFNRVFSLDSFIIDKISSFHNKNLDMFFIFVGNYSRVFIVGWSVLFFLVLYFTKRKKELLILLFSFVFGFIIENLVKLFVQRERPPLQLISETGYSFPSGHAISSVVLFTLFIYFYKDKIKNSFLRYVFIFIIVILIVFIGFSRIYLNVHWFSDVLVGYLFGLFIVFNIMKLFNYNPKYL